MTKRFRDTGLWMKEWFMKLEPLEKLAVQYLFDTCDCVGMWTPNFTLAETLVGRGIDWDGLAKKVNGNIEIQESGKWWLPDFCEFQYGKLTPDCMPHRKYIAELEKYDLLDRVDVEIRDPSLNKRRAHRAVARAIASGTITKPSACSACGGGGKMEAHHNDYTKLLDVVWLCSECHKKLHLDDSLHEGFRKASGSLQEEEEEEEVNLKTEKPTKPFFDTSINKWVNVTDDDVALWEKAYPACDIERELTKMAAWLLANPKKAPKSSYRRFITGWLSRTQDRGGTK